MSSWQPQKPQESIQSPFGRSKAMDTIDLAQWGYQLLARWKLIIGMALIFAIAVGVYSLFLATPLYEATATIYVLNPSDSVVNLSDLQLGNALAKDYIRVFKMWEVHEAVISQLDLPYSYEEMQEMLTLTNEKDTRMLDITITSANPEEAAEMANTYAETVSQFIAATMSTDQPNLMSTALVPVEQTSPDVLRNILSGFGLGAILACVYVIVRLLRDDTYKTAEEIRKYTGLVTLAVIPSEPFDQTKHFGRQS